MKHFFKLTENVLIYRKEMISIGLIGATIVGFPWFLYTKDIGDLIAPYIANLLYFIPRAYYLEQKRYKKLKRY